MKITERDILKYIFSPDSLEEEKRNYLELNPNRFKNQIEYCRQLKNNSVDAELEETLGKIEKRIRNFKLVELYPTKQFNSEGDSKLKLAANSINLRKKTYSCSFSDSTSEHLIKIVNNDAQTFLYLFSLAFTQKAIITFYPSQNFYNVEDISKPIEILEETVIEKITIEVI